MTYFSKICVGNTNAFKYGARAWSAHFKGIANINFSNQNVLSFKCDTACVSCIERGPGRVCGLLCGLPIHAGAA